MAKWSYTAPLSAKIRSPAIFLYISEVKVRLGATPSAEIRLFAIFADITWPPEAIFLHLYLHITSRGHWPRRHVCFHFMSLPVGKVARYTKSCSSGWLTTPPSIHCTSLHYTFTWFSLHFISFSILLDDFHTLHLPLTHLDYNFPYPLFKSNWFAGESA